MLSLKQAVKELKKGNDITIVSNNGGIYPIYSVDQLLKAVKEFNSLNAVDGIQYITTV